MIEYPETQKTPQKVTETYEAECIARSARDKAKHELACVVKGEWSATEAHVAQRAILAGKPNPLVGADADAELALKEAEKLLADAEAAHADAQAAHTVALASLQRPRHPDLNELNNAAIELRLQAGLGR